MATAKKNAKIGPIVGYGILCVLLLAFLIATLVGSWMQGSNLIQDKTFLAAAQEYFKKSPRSITQDDLNGIAYLKVTDSAVVFGDEAAVDTALSGNSESEVGTSVNLTADLSDFAGDLALLKGLKFFASSAKIYTDDLSVLKSISGLEHLNLDDAKPGDLSALAELSSLKTLSLNRVTIADPSVLKDLSNLESLSVNETGITSFEFLSAQGVKKLSATGNGIGSLSALSGMTALEELNVSSNNLKSLAGIEGLSALKTLNVNGNALVEDLSPVAGLSALETLNADGTAVKDLTPLSGLKALTTLSLDDAGVEDATPLKGLTTLTSLNLCGNSISDVTPLAALTELTTLNLEGNPVADWNVLNALSCEIIGKPEGEEAVTEEPVEEVTEAAPVETETETATAEK